MSFVALLRTNRNYRFTWFGQIVSEVGDHFNNIAVFSLVLEKTGSGLLVSGVLLARGLAMMAGGPMAGVFLDRMDRQRMMVLSDVMRAVVAVGFGFCLLYPKIWLLYLLSALLMFASPFFTSGRASILPAIASRQELHTANSLTQTTQWTTLALGTMMGGMSVTQLGYEWAFLFNAPVLRVLGCLHQPVAHGERFPAAGPGVNGEGCASALARVQGRLALHAEHSAGVRAGHVDHWMGYRRRSSTSAVQPVR